MSAIMIIGVFVLLMATFTLMYQMYRLIETDAKCRGLKHPKFWGVFLLGGNNGSGGLILYLIGRRKYQITADESEKMSMNSRKKKAGISLCFMAAATISLLMMGLFGYSGF